MMTKPVASESRIILASASPRRRELLAQIGVEFTVLPTSVDESRRPDERPDVYVERMALEKAQAGCQLARAADQLVLGADTVVVLDDHVLGKPADRDQALRTLAMLSGRTHKVMTAVALTDGQRIEHCLSITSVTMRLIQSAEAENYWQSGEPADKAGAYAVQGLGAMFIERLEGSYSGVVGLPLSEATELLSRFGYRVLAAQL